MGEEPEIMGCSSPLSWVLLAKERKMRRIEGRRKKRKREEKKIRFQDN